VFVLGERGRQVRFVLQPLIVLSGLDRWGISTQETLLMQQGESTHAKWAVDWAMLGPRFEEEDEGGHEGSCLCLASAADKSGLCFSRS
jgi:hypothetical protein